ncbi:MAG TPA: polysaccharide pyruvyl transferase family protein [Gemmatimonadales bacterium]
MDDRAPDAAETAGAPPDVLAQMRARIDSVLAPLVPKGAPVALLDFPDAGDAGDAAIWVGQLEALRARDIREPRYVATVETYDPLELRRHCPDGPILLSGGATFGDVFPRHQELREKVLHDFPDRRIVQLPQSIEFRSASALDAARRIVAGHRDFTLLVRSARSLDVARRFDAPSALCPDLAARMRTPAGPPAAQRRLLWIMANGKRPPGSAAEGIESAEWPGDEPSLARRAVTWIHDRPRALAALGRRLPPLYRRVAEARVRRGAVLLQQARALATDRIHVHLMALMAGIPHCLMDDGSGTVGAYYETWTKGAGGVAWCESADEAAARLPDLTA